MNIQKMLFQRQLVLLFVTTMVMIHCSRSDSNLSLKEVQAQDIVNEIESNLGTRAVLINFWATWCQPCVEEFPMIVDLGKTHTSNDLALYFVSVDWLDEQDRVQKFLNDHGVSGLSFIKNQDDMDFINGISKEWTGAVPFTMVFSKKTGQTVDSWESKKPKERFISAIEKALNS